ncbi:MAG: type VI secretion system tip protein VgrG, partial [Polyangiaceae bacterium]|nr:type VI secretion system tip protein VgrG [Polyangiaceae bacterium]
MALLELSFEGGERSLAVRRFSIREEMSGLFTVHVIAASPRPDLDAEAIVGERAELRLDTGLLHARGGVRRFRGVCCHMEQVRAVPEGAGESTYELRLAPDLWLLTQRTNHRLFQHLSVPGIARALLAEWGIDASFHIDEAAYPRLEYRVQYGETDYAFLCRQLEDAGISFAFADDGEGTRLVLADAPHLEPSRGPIHFEDDPTEAAQREHVTRVRIARDVRPGAVTMRDFDFRNPSYPLVAAVRAAAGREGRLESYSYAPGAFVVVKEDAPSATPAADDKATARHDEVAGQALAARRLAGARASGRTIRFETNVIDLHPGVIFSVEGHPSPDLEGRPLMVVELTLEGTPGEAWTVSGRAVLAGRDAAYAPPQRTPKPRIWGVQSAVVAGPPGEEIHTDEFGRVRVWFPWDREGRGDDGSSCWMRVSQGAAGGTFGLLVLPRVGQEVLVAFLEGDPDHPVVVGRLFNSTSPVPYGLPANKTVSAWKGESTPGGGGYNEIKFEDAKGREVLSIQAERDAQTLVKADEIHTVGNNRTKLVTASESVMIGANHTVAVGGNQTSTIGALDTVVVGERHTVMIAMPPEDAEGGRGQVADPGAPPGGPARQGPPARGGADAERSGGPARQGPPARGGADA